MPVLRHICVHVVIACYLHAPTSQRTSDSEVHPTMFGIECYVSAHDGFLGKWKCAPKDFIVSEISIAGRQAAVVAGEDVDLSRHLGIESTIKASNQEPEQLHEASGDRSCRNDLSAAADCYSEPAQDGGTLSQAHVVGQEDSIPDHMTGFSSINEEYHRTLIAGVLDKPTLDKLTTFAAKELEALHEHTSRSSRKSSVSLEKESAANLELDAINLGVIAAKESRTVLHKSVRYLYPHLRTKNHQIPDKGLEIHVSREPAVAQFQALQVPLQPTLDFIRFVETRDSQQTFSLGGLNCKDQRTKLHRLIARLYGSFLEAKTFGSGKSNEQEIVVRFRQKFKDHKKRRRERPDQGSTDGDILYTGFTLEKTNTETLSAIQQLARLIGSQPSAFSYAGIKDKKAVTTQLMAVKGFTPKTFQAALAGRMPSWLKVGNVQLRQEPIRVGELWGNHFNITLREVALRGTVARRRSDGEREDSSTLAQLHEAVQHCFTCVEKAGFLNYFGEQRFGAASLDPGSILNSVSPADVGLAMLQGNYKEAVKLLLSPDDGSSADPEAPVNLAKRCFQETGCPKQALRLMPAERTRECLLLKALNRHGTDQEGCVKALMNIPHSSRQLYIHAFCSLVWNKMASWRVKHYGLQAVAGDLVLDGDSTMKVHPVTKDDISQGKYSMEDVILPLPGNSIQYPLNSAGDQYRRSLDDAGLSECTFRLPALKLNIPGAYRRVIARTRNLHWEWIAEDKSSSSSYGDGALPLRSSTSLAIQNMPQASTDWAGSDATTATNDRDGSMGSLDAADAASQCHVTMSYHNNTDSTPSVRSRASTVKQPHEVESIVNSVTSVDNSMAGHTDIHDSHSPYYQDGSPSDVTILPTQCRGDVKGSELSQCDRNDSCHCGLAGETGERSLHSCKEKNKMHSQCQTAASSLRLSFDLPASCYATVFLREVMKV